MYSHRKTICLLILFLTTSSFVFSLDKKPRIAIIIDDIGYNYELGKNTISLPGAVTYAVIPKTPNGAKLANLAHDMSKEVMIHLPMQSTHTKRLDKGGLKIKMGKENFIETLKENLNSIPYISGANNHMGSLLTEQKQEMTWLMEELKKRKLFFVDSKTSAHSVAGKIASEFKIPTRNRHVFLDNDREVHSINKQFNELLEKARKYGDAIAIGHPHRATTDYLKKAIPFLQQAGIELVSVSMLMPNSHSNIIDSPVEEIKIDEPEKSLAQQIPPEYWWAEKTTIGNIERDNKAARNLMLTQIKEAENYLGQDYGSLKKFIRRKDLALSEDWAGFKGLYKDGDIVWKYVGDYYSSNVTGYVLVRNGKAVTSVTLSNSFNEKH